MSRSDTYPDYSNCIANIPNSVLKYFGAEPAGGTLKLLDGYLEDEYKNVIVMVLDGMGSSVLVWNADREKSFYQHQVGSIHSVFPSATVPATTSLMTGLQPCEHAWIGWDVYYKELDEIVTVFSNTIQGQDKPAADYHVAGTLTPYKSVFDRLNEAGVQNYCLSPFAEMKVNSVQEMLDKAKELCEKPGRKYIYAYWPSPDDLLHEFGGANEQCDKIKDFITDVESRVAEFTREMKDTLLVITADHGHVTTKVSQLEDYPELIATFERMPAIEPRLATFFIKKGMKREFTKLFTDIYGDSFELYTKEGALSKNLFGTGKVHEKFRDMLGDYIAVATDDITLVHTVKADWVSAHGGMYQSEMRVPVLIFKDFFFLGTDVDSYIDEALSRLKKKYPWADKSMMDKHYRYVIEEKDGQQKFLQYYFWDDGTCKQYDENWDGELFIERIITDQESTIQRANEIKEVFDVRPDYGVDCHGWCLERFEFRSHILGGYSAFVQAGDRTTGGSREFFFTPEQMSGTFDEFLDSNKELLSGHFGLDRDYMKDFKGLKEFLGFEK